MGGILYLHGFCSSSHSTKGQFLSACFKRIGVEVISPDLDEGDFRNTTLTRQLGLVRRLATARRPELLIGSSLGGYLAALHAARHPGTAPALVLMAPAFDFANRLKASLGGRMEQWRRDSSLPFFHYRFQREVPLAYGFVEDAARYEPFPEVTVPTRVLHGTRDEVVAPRLARDFARGRPNVKLEWFDADHGMVEAKEGIWSSVREFYLTRS